MSTRKSRIRVFDTFTKALNLLEEEDRQLKNEYHAGMSISEIAKVHDRTKGGIRSRLRKHGLVE